MKKDDVCIFDVKGQAALKIMAQPISAINRIKYSERYAPVKLFKAAPEKGKANHQILRILAKTLQAPITDLRIISGYTSKQKTILVRGLPSREVVSKLELSCPDWRS